GQLSRAPELLCRRPAVRRGRIAPRRQGQRDACADRPHRRPAGTWREVVLMSEETNPPGDIRAELRLRPEHPRVTRLSRKVLIGLGGASAIAILATLFWALGSGHRSGQSPPELYSTENRTPADGLASLPKDYTGIPRLGPALPGDLGRPILRAQEEGRPV